MGKTAHSSRKQATHLRFFTKRILAPTCLGQCCCITPTLGFEQGQGGGKDGRGGDIWRATHLFASGASLLLRLISL